MSISKLDLAIVAKKHHSLKSRCHYFRYQFISESELASVDENKEFDSNFSLSNVELKVKDIQVTIEKKSQDDDRTDVKTVLPVSSSWYCGILCTGFRR